MPSASALILYIIPLTGTILFLPITKVFISAFICTQVGNEIVLNEDNNIICFQNLHIIYMICAAIALIIYIPTAILLRPIWQVLQEKLDIRYKAIFLVTNMQIILIYVLLTSIITLSWVYLLISFAAISILIILQFTLKPCNLEKINYWKKISLICIMWTVVCSLIALLLNDTTNIWPAIIYYVGIVIILLLSYNIFKLITGVVKSTRGKKLIELMNAPEQEQPPPYQ